MLLRPSLLALAAALGSAWVSLSPTLLPRAWYFQGLVTGLAMALGYGLGVLLLAVFRPLLVRCGWDTDQRPWSVRTELRLRRSGLVVVAGAAVWVAVVATREHAWTWRRLGYEPGSHVWVYTGTFALALLVAGLLVVGLAVVRLAWRLGHRAGRVVLPSWLAAVLSLVVVVGGGVMLLDIHVYQRTLGTVNEAFAFSDRQVDLSVHPVPTSRHRSGGPASRVSWATLGHEGRDFVARGPSAARLRGAWAGPGSGDPPPIEPVRAFVGLEADAEPVVRARTAVAELERLGGLDRGRVLVVLPTGTGWVNERIVRPLERLAGGDVATVAMQYSHLPSPLAFLGERGSAVESGVALVAAVEERLATRGADRPQLLVAGESLGAYGLAGAFGDLEELLARTDGALFVGAPAMTGLRREAEEDRRPGSPHVRPVVGDGRRVVFANRPADLGGALPDAVFLQQLDDGVAWWDWRTAFRRPDWLAEPLAPEVNPALEWRPLVTFLNLTVDMAVSNNFDEGHGHRYGTMPRDAWVRILAAER
ncbi:MAG: alpha/beta-hydrolase family protein [Nocardioides sp.]|nr:alpha/beta-hydrolase family protein [Nocardioides sp.]